MIAVPSFEAAQAYLAGTIGETVSPRTSYKLDRMKTLLRELGNPHLGYPTIHVGGTSGKGSTCTMVAAALSASGKRTGLHTKPHLSDVTERARIGGVAIEREVFAAVLNAMMPAIEATQAQGFGRATYYETLLALAFTFFAWERVDVAVIEVGLGGRLDGTNVLRPEVAAITSVGYDHTEILGDTLDAIAREKAGIAKPGVPLVVASVPPDAWRAIEECATAAGARLVSVRDCARCDGGEIVTTKARYRLPPDWPPFQRTNAMTAAVALEELHESLRVPPETVEAAFAGVSLPGRMEVVPGRPTVVFDIAHNAEKAAHLAAALHQRFAGSRVHYVVAIGESKDADRIVAALSPLAESFTMTTFEAAGRAAASPIRLARIAESLGRWGRAISDPAEAFAVVRASAAPNDIVVVTGSTFIVAALRERMTEPVAGVS